MHSRNYNVGDKVSTVRLNKYCKFSLKPFSCLFAGVASSYTFKQ